MKYVSFVILILLLMFNCVSDSMDNLQINDEYHKPYSKGIVTLEMTFGEKSGLDDEFLLANPLMITVSDEGDMIVSDEQRIKVYDKMGKGKKIVGRPGNGPGEFEANPRFFLGPTGYLMTIIMRPGAGGIYNYYSLFAPDYTFIEKKRFWRKPIFDDYLKSKEIDFSNFVSIKKVVSLNNTEKVFELQLKKSVGGSVYESYILLLYETTDTFLPLLLIKNPSFRSTPNINISGANIGRFIWKLINYRRIIYINTNEDIYNKKKGSWYSLHILTLDSLEDLKINRQFIAKELPNYFFSERRPNDPIIMSRKGLKKLAHDRAKIYKDKKYYPSINSVVVDGNYVFLFHCGEYEDRVTLTDIFDLETNEFIGPVIFPRIFTTIKNGYAYEIAKDEEGFPEIRKYKINPEVYVK